MVRINLLPWRDWERERKQKEFLVNLGVAITVAVLAVVLWNQKLQGDIDAQEARNKWIQGEIAQLDEKIKDIRQLREERERLRARMQVIQELQGNRPVIVRIFDELVRTLASGVYYQTVKIEGTTLDITGVAESNARISAQMRNLDNSEWFNNPNLRGIQETPTASGTGSSFTMTVTRVTPSQGGEGEEGS